MFLFKKKHKKNQNDIQAIVFSTLLKEYTIKYLCVHFPFSCGKTTKI